MRETEALSLKKAILWIESLGIKQCMFETDSKLLADACNGAQEKSNFHTKVVDCVESFKHFENILVQFVYKSVKGVAHLLARASHSRSDLQEWSGSAPEFIADVLCSDMI